MKFSEFIAAGASRATSQQPEMIGAAFGQKVPEIWREIAELNFAALRACVVFKSLSDQALADMSVDLVYQLVSSMGGGGIYLPNGDQVVKREKIELIANEYRGNNIRTLAKKYHVSENRVRQIVKEQENLKRAA